MSIWINFLTAPFTDCTLSKKVRVPRHSDTEGKSAKDSSDRHSLNNKTNHSHIYEELQTANAMRKLQQRDDRFR